MSSAWCCHEWTIFHVPEKSFWSEFWAALFRPRSGDRSHRHFNSWYDHIIHSCQNGVMDAYFGGSNDTINLFPFSIGDISFNDLIMTFTVLTWRSTQGIGNKIPVLWSYCFIFSYTTLGTVANKEIVHRFIQCCELSFYVWEPCLQQQLNYQNEVKTTVQQ